MPRRAVTDPSLEDVAHLLGKPVADVERLLGTRSTCFRSTRRSTASRD
jgi:hypothetical protein